MWNIKLVKIQLHIQTVEPKSLALSLSLLRKTEKKYFFAILKNLGSSKIPRDT